MPDITQAAQAKSIQELPDAKSGKGLTTLTTDFQGVTFGRDAFLPKWGSRRREKWLRAYDRHELNTLYQGAVAGIIKKVQSSPWEISGPKSGTQHFQDMLRHSQFGRGWDDFIALVLRDYLRHDIGAFVEVIGPGKPDGPLTGRAIGLAHLDTMKCYLTGDPEYPVLYRSKGAGDHLLHHTRVLHFVDMPDGDENTHKAVGLCALSRAAALVEREMMMNRYVSWRLDDKPPPGIMLTRNMTEKSFMATVNRYRDEIQRDMPPEWGQTMMLFGTAVEHPIEMTPVTFSQAPEKFDYKIYKVDINVNELALALGIDVQEIWQLSGGNIGSGAQSAILHSKSRGKTFGTILKMLERAINNVLPPAYEFEFKFEDTDADLERAQVAQTWVSVVNQAASVLTPDEQRRILANKIDAIADAITDEDGQVVRLDDADPVDDVSADDVGAPPESTPAPEDEVTADDEKALKEWDGTRSTFVNLVIDAISAATGGGMNKRRFSTVMRAHLRRLGTEAFKDGLEDGGVSRDDMDDRDRAAVQEWLRIQSPYVTNFAKRVFDDGLSEAQVAAHAEMWGNKSLRDAFQLGQASAGWNGMYIWRLGKTEEHCTDCQRLNGQIHRMRDWKKKGWLPGAEQLECHGYNCDCRLEVTGKRAFGRF